MSSAPLGGVVMLDTSLAGPAMTQGVCTSGCIRYQRLQAAGNYLIEAAAGAGQTGPFTLDVTRPRAPAAPRSPAQLRTDSVTPVPGGGSTGQTGVVLRGGVSGPGRFAHGPRAVPERPQDRHSRRRYGRRPVGGRRGHGDRSEPR